VSANLLVVCTANIARSPLAEALFEVHARARGLDGQVGIVSAGTRARVGDAAAPPSVEIAATWGVDLRRHRSQPVSDELLERSDLVLTMTEEHRDVLSGRGARVAQRCFTVRELHRLLEDVEVAVSPMASPGTVQPTGTAGASSGARASGPASASGGTQAAGPASASGAAHAAGPATSSQTAHAHSTPPAERIAEVVQQAHRRRPVSARPGPEDIRDPYGHSHDVYRSVATELVELVGALATPLLGPVPPAAHANLPRSPRARRQGRRRRGS